MDQFHLAPKNFLILIVDDTEANIRLLSHVLRGEGFNIIAAFDGEECLEIARKRTPDLILLDVLMPGSSGFEVCKQLKKIPDLQETPVIFLTALTELQNKLDGFEAGGVDYITKPFQKDEVLARIKTHLRLNQLKKERIQQIEKLQLREIELNELNRKKDGLVRIVSHDIQNPITGIIGLANILRTQEHVSADDRTNMLRIIEESGRKLLDLVDSVLAADESTSSLIQVQFKAVDIINVFERVVSVNKPKSKLKNIALDFDVSTKVRYVEIDQVKLEIALNNLVSNALKFTQSGGSVQLRATNTLSHLIINVEDTGIGIPEHLVDKLFVHEPNKKVSSLGTDGEIGSGLGLDVVQNYISLHRGKIDVKSEEGIGTTFRIEIPLTHS